MTGTIFALVLTLGAYAAAAAVWQRCGRHPLLNPTLFAIAGVATALLALNMQHADYFASAELVHALLGPAVVALAVPLYRHAAVLRARAGALLMALVLGSATAVLVGVAVAVALNVSAGAVLSLAPRSATTAVSMGVAAEIGGIPALTAVLTIATGITGAVLGGWILDAMGVRDPLARGFALGTASHGIATARAFQDGEAAGIAAGLAMGLNAILTAVIAPPLARLLLSFGGGS